MGHYVYKYVDKGKIIYIGKCDTYLPRRIYEHSKEKKFAPYLNSEIYYINVANKTMSDVVESELIKRYSPRLNSAKTKSDWCGLDFVEPKWNKFVDIPKACFIKRNKKRSAVYTDYSESATYYSYILNNMHLVKEDENYYYISIPYVSSTSSKILTSIAYENDKCYAFLTLVHCIRDNEVITFYFRKNAIFEEFFDLPTGLKNRIMELKKQCLQEQI